MPTKIVLSPKLPAALVDHGPVVIRLGIERLELDGRVDLDQRLVEAPQRSQRSRVARPKRSVVGIVGDVRSMGLTAPAPDEIYLRIRQFAARLTFVVVRTDGDPAALRPILRSTMLDLDRNQPIALFQTLDASLAQALGAQRIAAWITVVFAALALFLSALGLYSVLAYAVTQRTTEIGIRTALGATRHQVVALVLRSGLKLWVVGLVLGLAAAAGAARLIQTLLYYVQPLDPLIYSAVTVLFALIAILACLLPSLRASRIDPIIALRAG